MKWSMDWPCKSFIIKSMQLDQQDFPPDIFPWRGVYFPLLSQPPACLKCSRKTENWILNFISILQKALKMFKCLDRKWKKMYLRVRKWVFWNKIKIFIPCNKKNVIIRLFLKFSSFKQNNKVELGFYEKIL